MTTIEYPENDPRRKDALLPHGTPVTEIGKTANCIKVQTKDGKQWLVHGDYLKR